MPSLEEIAQKIIKYDPNFDIDLLNHCYESAERIHRGKWRKDGSPFITHPLAVADILVDLKLDIVSICASLLHDVEEDTRILHDQLSAILRDHPQVSEILTVVDGLTKLKKLRYSSKEQYQAENIRKMIFAMAKDIRVIFVKLADRLHNMRTLSALEKEKQIDISEETFEIFAPLAHRLGMHRIKAELEDLAFQYKIPEEYQKLKKLVLKGAQERENFISKVISSLEKKLKENKIEAEITGRQKHLYSIYKKMVSLKKTFDEIYDVIAVRVIVKTVQECYQALGVINSLWPPIPNTFDDYISVPKINMYQALHSAVMGDGGQPFEVQIKTEEMYRIAEYGIAAHWRYKEGEKVDKNFEEKISWIRELVETHKGKLDAKELLESFKSNIFEDEIFVFSPKGEIFQLPAGSTPVDFAYKIHTEIGNHCIGAKVQGKIVPLYYQLKNGEKVEILTQSSAKPSLDWLSFVKSSHTRAKIRNWFRKQKKEETIKEGRIILEKEAKKLNFNIEQLFDEKKLLEIAKKFNFRNINDLFAAIGYGDINSLTILSKIEEGRRKEQKKIPSPIVLPKKREGDIIVEGLSGCEVKISRCCMPLPGEEIIGCITKKRGITIHKNNCVNLLNRIQEKKITKDRFVKVAWNKDRAVTVPIELIIEAQDKLGLLNEITSIIKEEKTNISFSKMETYQEKAIIKVTLDIQNKETFNSIIRKLKLLREIETIRKV